jgi:hypothetical protein
MCRRLRLRSTTVGFLVLVPIFLLSACGSDDIVIGPEGEEGDVLADAVDAVVGDTADVALPDTVTADGVGTCVPADCNDQNPCTTDTCDAAGVCQHVNNTVACDDGDMCTTNDACSAGKCVGGGAANCDDGSPCTTDSCEKATGCVHTAFEGACDDGDGCTQNDVCKDGKCGNGAALTCDDGNPCTDDKCSAATGCTYLPNTTACTDGNACTKGDKCAAGKCEPGSSAVTCDDNNPCTDDSCDPDTGNCAYKPNTGACNDGNDCTTGDACSAGLCFGKPSCSCTEDKECDDKDACTFDTCNQGVCQFDAASDNPCDDGDACTQDDKCFEGKCKPGTAKICDDNNACTTDKCVPGLGCVAGFNADVCDDGNACTQGDACSYGKCLGTPFCECKADADCNDGLDCTDDACVAGKCASKPAGNGKACNDGNSCTVDDTCQSGECLPGKAKACDDQNPCTTDACDVKTGNCTTTPNTTPCNDNDFCTSNDACKEGKCQGGGVTNCDDGMQCTNDSCDPGSGCGNSPKSGSCEDGNPCTEGDYCGTGECKTGTVKSCDDKNPCTKDSCDQVKGCMYEELQGSCDDGNACTTDDTCISAVCTGAEKVCNDSNACTTDACDPATGCKHEVTASACDDGDACTKGDTCIDGTCKPGAALTCDDNNPCTEDTCDPKTGCAAKPLADGAVCVAAGCSGLTFTSAGVCQSSTCVPGDKKDCNDGNVCTDDACDPAKGCSATNNVASCNDGSACTKSDTCKDGACTASQPVVCDDGNACTVDSCDPTKGCQSASATDGTTCIAAACDGLTQVPASTCTAGTCVKTGDPINCNDNNPCSDDSCNPSGGCGHVNNTVACSDGDACTTQDACSAGLCKGGNIVICNDNLPCTDDSCDKLVGCKTVNNTAACDDGSLCTVNDACANGVCKSGAALVCDDKNPCTDDKCDPTKGCTTTPNTVACNDGNECSTDDFCAGGVCKGTGGKNCDDNNLCTTDSCDAQGGCINLTVANGTSCGETSCTGNGQFQGAPVCSDKVCGAPPAPKSCDDNNVCTNDLCNPQTGCIQQNNTNACNDNSLCTVKDVCSAGKCGGEAVVCDDKNICTNDTCDPVKGCVYTANTVTCDDSNACTTNDKCAATKCVGGVPPTCDDKNACTDDKCDTVKGCVFTNNVLSCSDNDACTTKDTCANGSCVGGPKLVCNDNKVCTNDSCDPGKGCVFANNTAACDDNDACTTKDVCAVGLCVGSVPPDCDDKNFCTNDLCDAVKGCVHLPWADGVPCADGLCAGTQYQPVSTCISGKCVPPAPKTCDDGLECTTDVCDPKAGCGAVDKAFGTVCKSGAPNTIGQFCSGSLCTGLEISVQAMPGGTVQGMLTGIGRTGDKAPVNLSAWSGYYNGTTLSYKVGSMVETAETNLTISARGTQGFNSGWYTSMNAMANRLSVGDYYNNQYPLTMEPAGAPGYWSSNNSPQLWNLFSFYPRGLTAVDVYAANNNWMYVYGGPSYNQGLVSTLGRVSHGANNAWVGATRMAIGSQTSLSCGQVRMDVADIFAASDKAVFIAGSVLDANGSPTYAGVAFWDGNAVSSCGGAAGFSGLALIESNTLKEPFVAPINPVGSPSIGALRAIDGSAADHVLAGGAYGTLLSFEGGKWASETPNFVGMPVVWSAAFDVRSIEVSDKTAWVAGEYYSLGVCRAVFVLHGTYDGTKWVWDKLLIYDKNLITCGSPNEQTSVGRIWLDGVTGSLYVVGSQGTNDSGTVVTNSPTQRRPLVARIKLK